MASGLLAFAAPPPVAAAPPGAAPYVAEADALGLADHPTWVKLGRYERTPLARERRRSAVVSPHYFLDPSGRKRPAAELAATITALTTPVVGEAADDHALCRFPARALWLKTQLDLPIADPYAVCPAFRAWAREGAISGVSVVFASGYLSNPGSAYGHLLMRFHSDGPAGRDDLLETSINYGAADSEGDPFIPYVVKGLFGGYRSTFTDLEYFNHNRRYREEQLRDVWAYHLNLTQYQVDFLVAHTWEMLGQENKYYFLRQNCAYRIAELVNVVVDEPLIADTKLWLTPVDVFQVLSARSTDGAPLVDAVERLPSRQTVFREGYASLPREARRVVDAVAAGYDPTDALGDGSLSPTAQAAALDVALDYKAFFAATQDDGDPAGRAAAARRHQLLLARMQLPPGTRGDGAASRPPPHAGQFPSLAQISAVFNDELGAGVELRVRPAYYDFLSADPGTVKYSELSMFDLRLLVRDGDLSLRQLELFRVTALNISPTGMPGDGGPAWSARAGLEARDLSCDDCLVGYLEGGFGRASELGPLAAFGLLSGRLQVLDVDDNYAQAGVAGGLLAGGGPWKAVVTGGVLSAVDDEFEALPFVRAETRLGEARRWDVRLGVEHREALEASGRFSLYW